MIENSNFSFFSIQKMKSQYANILPIHRRQDLFFDLRNYEITKNESYAPFTVPKEFAF